VKDHQRVIIKPSFSSGFSSNFFAHVLLARADLFLPDASLISV